MPDHAKEYSFDVIEFTMHENESCFDQFEFCKTLMKVMKPIWKLTIMQISLLRVRFAQLNTDWRNWTYFSIIVWILVPMIAYFL